MHLEKLRLINFRRYDKFETDFSDKINIVTGNNGVCKSSALEAAHYLSSTKSFRSNRDVEVIRFNYGFFVSIEQVIIATTDYKDWSDMVGFKVNKIGLT